LSSQTSGNGAAFSGDAIPVHLVTSNPKLLGQPDGAAVGSGLTSGADPRI